MEIQNAGLLTIGIVYLGLVILAFLSLSLGHSLFVSAFAMVGWLFLYVVTFEDKKHGTK